MGKREFVDQQESSRWDKAGVAGAFLLVPFVRYGGRCHHKRIPCGIIGFYISNAGVATHLLRLSESMAQATTLVKAAAERPTGETCRAFQEEVGETHPSRRGQLAMGKTGVLCHSSRLLAGFRTQTSGEEVDMNDYDEFDNNSIKTIANSNNDDTRSSNSCSTHTATQAQATSRPKRGFLPSTAVKASPRPFRLLWYYLEWVSFSVIVRYAYFYSKSITQC